MYTYRRIVARFNKKPVECVVSPLCSKNNLNSSSLLSYFSTSRAMRDIQVNIRNFELFYEIASASQI